MAILSERRVDFPMIDMAGVVYYPEYFDLAHRFFEESWFSIIGRDYHRMVGEDRIGFPAVSTEAEHLAPLRYGDLIRCRLWIESVGTTSLIWRYRFEDQAGRTVWTARVVTVCVDLDTFEKQPIPTEWVEPLRTCTED